MLSRGSLLTTRGNNGKPEFMNETLLIPREVAALLGVSIATLNRWRHVGCGPRWVKIGGTDMPRYRYRPSDLAAWVEQQARDDT